MDDPRRQRPITRRMPKPTPNVANVPTVAPRVARPGHAGAVASATWLVERGLRSDESRWFVEIELPTASEDTRLQLDIYAEEWGFQVHHRSHVSWIRVTDVPFAHGRDDLVLLPRTPELSDLGPFIVLLERELGVRFDRAFPRIRTRLPDADPVLRAWVAAL